MAGETATTTAAAVAHATGKKMMMVKKVPRKNVDYFRAADAAAAAAAAKVKNGGVAALSVDAQLKKMKAKAKAKVNGSAAVVAKKATKASSSTTTAKKTKPAKTVVVAVKKVGAKSKKRVAAAAEEEVDASAGVVMGELGHERKRRKRTPTAVAYREIAKYQKRADHLLPVTPFQHLFKHLAVTNADGIPDDSNVRVSSEALVLAQEGFEQMLVQVASDGYTYFANRKGARHGRLLAEDVVKAAKLKKWMR